MNEDNTSIKMSISFGARSAASLILLSSWLDSIKALSDRAFPANKVRMVVSEHHAGSNSCHTFDKCDYD